MSVWTQVQPSPPSFMEIFRNLFRARAIYWDKRARELCEDSGHGLFPGKQALASRPTEWDDPT